MLDPMFYRRKFDYEALLFVKWEDWKVVFFI